MGRGKNCQGMGLCDEEGYHHEIIDDKPILIFHATKQTIYNWYVVQILNHCERVGMKKGLE